MGLLVGQEQAFAGTRQRRVAVGIDPSRVALQMSLLSPDGDKPRSKRVALGPSAVKAVANLLQGHDGVIAMEGSYSTGQLFLLELLEHQYDVREIHPMVSKRFREALTEDHTDQTDADGMAFMGLLKRDLPPVRFSEGQAVCKRLSRLRDRLGRDHTRYLNRLHACLSETYGASYKGLFQDLSAKKALSFFQQYPTINDAIAGDPDVPLQIGKEVWERLKRAGCWREGTYLKCLRTEIGALAAHILSLHERIYELEQEMAKIPPSQEQSLVLTMPQAGLITAMTIVGNNGDISRFGGNVHRYVAYCGLAPARHQSGASESEGKTRRRYNRHLKRAYVLLAWNQARLNPQAREYYARKRCEGKGHWAALRCLARHLCRVVFHILTTKKTYQQLNSEKNFNDHLT
jgi:transposase